MNKKNNTYLNLLIVFLLIVPNMAISQESDKTLGLEPVLITSVGQSADGLMVKVLAKKAKIDFEFDKLASAEKIKSVKSIIVVTGGSTKGLGAAKIDKADEHKRGIELFNAARDAKIPIIVIHVGGKSRRGTLSDYFNTLCAANADELIVVASGNHDGFFQKIADEKKIRLQLPEKIVHVKGALEEIFKPKE